MFSRLRLAVLLLGVSVTLPLIGQGPPEVVKRPSLPADRDSNSAGAYFYYGTSIINRDPDRATAAFYWASRLEPGWADPWYGQYIASLLAQPPSVLTGYLTRRRSTLQDPKIQRIDSLAYAALLRNPLVDRRLDATLLETWLLRETQGTLSTQELARGNPRMAGWLAYSRGRFKDAAKLYGQAVARSRESDPTLHLQRALPFVAMGQLDSALEAMQLGLTGLRGPQSEQALYSYESYPMIEYGIGLLFEHRGMQDSASAAYERALLDDLSFYPAHRSLARMRLARGDTTGARGEYAQAIALRPDDPVSTFEYALVLLAATQVDSAVLLFAASIKAEPFYSRPHLPLGMIYERGGFTEEATEHYEAFLRLAPKTMVAEVEEARHRLQILRAAPP